LKYALNEENNSFQLENNAIEEYNVFKMKTG